MTAVRFARRAVCVGLLSHVAQSVAQAQSYSSQPLLAPVAYPVGDMPRAPADFVTWLRTAEQPFDDQRRQAAREHLFALIAARVKSHYGRAGTDIPEAGDSLLADLYSAAYALAVPGADLVLHWLRPGGNVRPQGSTTGFSLTFTAPLFTLVSERGNWLVRFPYYFMPGVLSRQRLNNSLDNEVALISTLTAANDSVIGGASQATLLIVSAETPSIPEYAAFWLTRLGLAPGDNTPGQLPNVIRGYRAYDGSTGLWKELAVLATPRGALLVAYIGLNGTYQANRQHYLDLLGTVRVRQ